MLQKIHSFLSSFELITVLLLIRNSDICWSTRFITSPKVCGGLSIFDSVLSLLKFIFWFNKIMDTLTLREHQQKTLVTLSGFWLLRGWGVWMNPIKKRKICDKSLFPYNVEWSFVKLLKIISADVKAKVKQEIK